MKESKLDNLVWMIFLISGLVFAIIGVVICVNMLYTQGKVKTIGVIEEVSYGREHSSYTIVSFEVNGEKITARANGYSSGFYKGKEIEIYYNEENPNQISIPSLDLLFLMFPGIGVLFVGIGGTGLLVKWRKKKREEKLREDGDVIYGDYVETRLNTSYSVNNRHPYNIICEWYNVEDGKTYIFKSNNMWMNPENKIEEQNITTFPIYIDLEDKKNYMVDIDSLTEDVVDLS